jgi:uncharacterized protein
MRDMRDMRDMRRQEFREHVAPLLENELVLRLDGAIQHFKFTRLRHSMDVAYISFLIARLFRWDSRSVARAGLLHDLFFHSEGQNCASLLRSHPKIALENARAICELNRVEEDIILSHMWLLTLRLPRYKEGYIVTMVDKCCALREFLVSLFASRLPAGRGCKRLLYIVPAKRPSV